MIRNGNRWEANKNEGWNGNTTLTENRTQINKTRNTNTEENLRYQEQREKQRNYSKHDTNGNKTKQRDGIRTDTRTQGRQKYIKNKMNH